MTYKRSMLNGYDKATRKIIAQQLGIPAHKPKSKHESMRRRKHMAKAGGRFGAFQRRLEGKGMTTDQADKKQGNKKTAIVRRKANKEAM